MSALALRVLSLAIPALRADLTIVRRAEEESGASEADPGVFRFLLAIPGIYVDAARGLWNAPPWASRRYVPDMAAHRAHDVEVARRLLAKHGRDRMVATFPKHAALLGITAQAEATVTVTVVEPERLALPAGPAIAAEATLARPLAEASR